MYAYQIFSKVTDVVTKEQVELAEVICELDNGIKIVFNTRAVHGNEVLAAVKKTDGAFDNINEFSPLQINERTAVLQRLAEKIDYVETYIGQTTSEITVVQNVQRTDAYAEDPNMLETVSVTDYDGELVLSKEIENYGRVTRPKKIPLSAPLSSQKQPLLSFLSGETISISREKDPYSANIEYKTVLNDVNSLSLIFNVPANRRAPVIKSLERTIAELSSSKISIQNTGSYTTCLVVSAARDLGEHAMTVACYKDRKLDAVHVKKSLSPKEFDLISISPESQNVLRLKYNGSDITSYTSKRRTFV